MTSLCPGPLFGTPGLNHYSTPSSRTDTPSDIHKGFQRVPFNSVPWPKPSPVSKVYDVQNSSTKMILLNNKYSKKSQPSERSDSSMKGCRLRGHTSHDGDIRAPDPTRHSSDTPHVNRRGHIHCGDSGSPVFRPASRANIKWRNESQRPPMKFEDGSSVNYKRHTSCMGSDDLRHMNWNRPRRPYSTSIIRESMRSRSPLLEDLNPGERLYMYSIAKVYNVESMRKLKQSQYCHILHREVERGVYTDEECQRYWRYLSRPRKTQQGPDDSFQRRRIKSAPGRSPREKLSDRSQSRDTTGRSTVSTSALNQRSKSRSSTYSTASSRNRTNQGRVSAGRGDKSDPQSSRRKQDDTRGTRHQQGKSKTENEQKTKTTKKQSSPQKKSRTDEKSPNDPLLTQVELDNSLDSGSYQNEAPVRGQEVISDSSDDERTPRHKEGRDRPKSRLGRGRIGKNKRDVENSDDDYSSDSSLSSSDESYTEPTSRSEVSKSEVSKSEVSKSEVSKSEVSKSEVSKSEASKSETTSKSEASKSEASGKSDKSRPDSSKSEASQSAQQKQSTESKSSAQAPQDNSYSEDFTETSTSEKVNQQKNERKKSESSDSSDSSDSESSGSTVSDSSVTKTPEKKPTSELAAPKQDENTEAPKSSRSDDSSKSENSSKASSRSKVSDEVKVSDGVKASDQSYSDDFTDSKSSESKMEKTAASSKRKTSSGSKNRDNQNGKDDRKKENGDQQNENAPESGRKERRDSVELDRDGRSRDWDKIEY